MRKIIQNDQDREHPLITVFNLNKKHNRYIQYQKIGYMVSKETFYLSKISSYKKRSK